MTPISTSQPAARATGDASVVYERELGVDQAARDLLANPPASAEAWARAFAQLAASFRSLLSQSIKLTRISDSSQKRLIKTQEQLAKATTKYRTIYEQCFEGIFQCGLDGKFLAANPAFVSLLGYESEQEMLATISDMGTQVYVDPTHFSLIVARVCRTVRADAVETEVRRKDGRVVWWHENIHAVRGAEGNVLYLEGSVLDISARKENEIAEEAEDARLKVQNAALVRLSRSKELLEGQWESSLALITVTAAETLRCRRCAVWWRDSSTGVFRRELPRQLGIARRVKVLAEPRYLEALRIDRLLTSSDVARDPRLDSWLPIYLGPEPVSAAMQVPLFRHAEVVGVLTIEHRGELRNWSPDEQNFATSIADLVMLSLESRQRQLAHLALEKSQRALAAELAQAALYVRSLLPEPMSGAIAADWRFVTSTALGGDAFGYHWLDDHRLAIYLLDVCGHGVRAALLSISALNTLRSHHLQHADAGDPGSVLAAMNEAFPMEKHHQMYLTLWYGVYDQSTQELTYASAGHPPAIAFAPGHGSASPVELGIAGLMIGAIAGTTYDTSTFHVAGGTTLFLFSDGIYELWNPAGEMWTQEAFVESLRPACDPGQSGLDRVLDAARAFQGAESFDDDYSIMRLIFDPPGQPPSAAAADSSRSRSTYQN